MTMAIGGRKERSDANAQMGSGNCGKPAQCRDRRDATARRRVTRALAEIAETPNRAFAASAKDASRRLQREQLDRALLAVQPDRPQGARGDAGWDDQLLQQRRRGDDLLAGLAAGIDEAGRRVQRVAT